MGLDLTLIFNRWTDVIPWDLFLATDRLEFHRNYALFDAIKAIPSHPLPEGKAVEWYGDKGIDRITEDPYGDPLRWVTAANLSTIHPSEELCRWNRAVMAFVQCVPPKTIIVLRWH